jgi:hypothetical protein
VTMLVLVAVVTVPALARTDQAAQEVANRAQGAVEKGEEEEPVSQAIDQAHNQNQTVDQSSVQEAGGSLSGLEAAFLLVGTIALFVIVGALAYRIFRGSRNHTYGGLGSSFWRMRRRG